MPFLRKDQASSSSERHHLLELVDAEEEELQKVEEGELLRRARKLRGQAASSGNLDPLVVEAFSLVREAARRAISQRPYDVQVLAGIALHQGRVIEMQTGEGKTLAAVAPAFLRALTGRGGSYPDLQRLSGTPRCGLDGPRLRASGLHRRLRPRKA